MRGRLRRYTYDKLHIHAYTVRVVCKVFRLLDKVTFLSPHMILFHENDIRKLTNAKRRKITKNPR